MMSLEQQVRDLQAALAARETDLAERDAALAERDTVLAAKDRELTALTAGIARLQQQVARQLQEIEQLLRRLYGRKSEKAHPDQLLFDQLLIDVLENAKTTLADEAQATAEAATTPDPPPATCPKPRRRHPGRQVLPVQFERVEIPVDIPADEKVDPLTGQPLVKIGEERTEKLEYLPGRYRVTVYVRPKYALPRGKGVVIAELPPFVLDRCLAAPSFLAHVLVSRFCDHLPYYRQSEIFAREHLTLHRNDLDGWMVTLGTETFVPLYDVLRQDVLDRDYVGIDDTVMPLLVKGRGRVQKGRMWLCRAVGPPHHVFFHFAPDRTKGRVAELLGPDYQGYVQADAYGGHDETMRRAGIVEVGCWAHARRKFEATLPYTPREAGEVLGLIAGLYQLEKLLAPVEPAVRLAHRQAAAQPIVDRLFVRLGELRPAVLPQSLLGKAITYAKNQEVPLRRYLTDGRLQIDNNLVENTLRPLALGRRNWLFAGSESGGHAAAVILSLSCSCKAMGHNPWVYFTDLLTKLPTQPADRLRELLPGYWTAPTA